MASDFGLSFLTQFGSRLATVTSRLADLVLPTAEWDCIQGGWRHPNNAKEMICFLLTKAVGAVSTTNAMLLLCTQGFWFQAAVLARAIREANLCIVYGLPSPNAEEWPTDKQQKAIKTHFWETWSDPRRPFEDTNRRPLISLQDLANSLREYQDTPLTVLNPHDAGQAALQDMRLLSDYTHMAYPRLMELWMDSRSIALMGSQENNQCFRIVHAAGITLDTARRVRDITFLLHRGFEFIEPRISDHLSGLESELDALCHELEGHIERSPEEVRKILAGFKDKGSSKK